MNDQMKPMEFEFVPGTGPVPGFKGVLVRAAYWLARWGTGNELTVTDRERGEQLDVLDLLRRCS